LLDSLLQETLFAMDDIKYHNTSIKNIINYLGSSFPGKSENFSDVLITCCDGQVKAHKLVLASISQMLYSEFKQNTWDETLSIVLPDYSLPEVTHYLKAVYSCQDINKFKNFNQMIGSIETEEIEIDSKAILDIDNVNVIHFKTEEIEIDNEYILDTENVNAITFQNEKISSLPEDLNFEPIEDSDKAKIINIVRKKKESRKVDLDTKIKRNFLWKHFTVNPSNSKEINCNICSKQYSYEAILMRTTILLDHLFTHDIIIEQNNKTRSWKCLSPVCSRVFISEDKMNKHFFLHHSENLPCAYCGKVIKERLARIRHEKEHRVKAERKFSCDICSKAFIDKTSLKRHSMIHTGEKPYQCSDCGKQFVQLDKLKNHRRHHTGETPYECSKCLRKFKFKQVYDKHKCIPQN